MTLVNYTRIIRRTTSSRKEMRELHSIVGIGFVVVISTLGYASKTPSSTLLFNVDPPVHVLQVSLLTCDRACRCTDACAHTNFTNRCLHCELVQGNQPGRNLYFEMRSGLVQTDEYAISATRTASKETGRECSQTDATVCPYLVIDGVNLVLDNLTTITDRRLIQMTWSPGPDGWGTTSCKFNPECGVYDTRKKPSTMREACQLHSECVDAESECRDGQCWCKPGLSHDPDSQTCVSLCPGQYGPTFQEVSDCYYPFSGKYLYFAVANMQACMDKCLNFVDPQSTWYTCKYVDYSHRKCRFNNQESETKKWTCASLEAVDCTCIFNATVNV